MKKSVFKKIILITLFTICVKSSFVTFAKETIKSSDKINEEQIILEINNETKDVEKKRKIVSKEKKDIENENASYKRKYQKFRSLANKKGSNVSADVVKKVEAIQEQINKLTDDYKAEAKEIFNKRQKEMDEYAEKRKSLLSTKSVITDDEYRKTIEKFQSEGGDSVISIYGALIACADIELRNKEDRENILLKINRAKEKYDVQKYLLDKYNLELKEVKEINSLYKKMDEIICQYVDIDSD